MTNGTATQQEAYAYDSLGNRLTKSVGVTSPVITAYVHDAANQLKEIRSGSSCPVRMSANRFCNESAPIFWIFRAFSLQMIFCLSRDAFNFFRFAPNFPSSAPSARIPTGRQLAIPDALCFGPRDLFHLLK